MRTKLPLLLLVAACDPGVYEPYTPPDGARDLNATTIEVSVRTERELTQLLQGQKRTIDRLDVVARMSDTEGFAPSVKLPADPTQPLTTTPSDPGVQDEGSAQPTATVLLRGYPRGRLDVQVTAYSAGEAVGAGCDRRTIDALATTPETSARVVLTSPPRPCLP